MSKQLTLLQFARRIGAEGWPGVRNKNGRETQKRYRENFLKRLNKPECFKHGKHNKFAGKDPLDFRKIHEERVIDYYQSLGEKISAAIRAEFGAFCYEFRGPEDGMTTDAPIVDYYIQQKHRRMRWAKRLREEQDERTEAAIRADFDL